MTTKFRQPVTMTVTGTDLAAILTEALCTFNALADLEVLTVKGRTDGQFELSLLPKERPRPAAKKEPAP